jgi:hypothetical protein
VREGGDWEGGTGGGEEGGGWGEGGGVRPAAPSTCGKNGWKKFSKVSALVYSLYLIPVESTFEMLCV